MNFLICLATVLVLSLSEKIESAYPNGSWLKTNQVNSKGVPNYYICGAQISRVTPIKLQPQACLQQCISGQEAKPNCLKKVTCASYPSLFNHEESITNGIKFKFCSYLNWTNQIELGEQENNTDWLLPKMCPEDQYVVGYRVKITEKSGISGLMLFCKLKKSK